MQTTEDGTKFETVYENDSIIQFRFIPLVEENPFMSAAALAECLTGLNELTGIMQKSGLFDSVASPDVMIRPVREGSFLLDVSLLVNEVSDPLAIEAAMSGAEAMVKELSDPVAIAAGAIGLVQLAKNGQALVETMNVLINRANNAVIDIEESNTEFTIVRWADGTVDQIAAPIWREFSSSSTRTKRSLKKILNALGSNQDRLEVRLGNANQTSEEIEAGPVAIIVDRETYRHVATIPDEIEESEDYFETEATAEIIDFTGENKWRITTSSKETRSVSLEDYAFLQKVNEGLTIGKSDIFNFKIKENKTVKNGRTTRNWTIVEVISHRRGIDEDEATQ